MAIFEVGDKVIYDGRSEWLADALLLPAGSEGIVEKVYDLGDEYGDVEWEDDDPGYDVNFGMASAGIAFTVEEEHLFSGDHSIYNVERKVDTVIVEMDEHVAEMLAVVLDGVIDGTRATASGFGGEFEELRLRLRSDAGIRKTSRRYNTMNYLLLRDAL